MGNCWSLSDREDPLTINVPFGHVPYNPSLPGVMGPQDHFPIEWWYYGGWATDAENSKTFTILVYGLRALIDGGIMYGIGVNTPSSTPETTFTTKTDMLALKQLPVPTPTSWSQHIKSSHNRMTCKLISGTLGLSGATYRLKMNDSTNNVEISLNLKSNTGLVQEGASGAFPGIDTMQFAMPAMSIEEDSTITMNGETTQIAQGNIWLERQSVKMFNVLRPLYLGNWLAITMNDRTSYTISFYWPKREEKGTQWIVGTEVGYPPSDQTALEYSYLQEWDGSAPVQGVNVMKNEDFDLNILNPSDPENSPHWKSSTNEEGNTYCTAWNLKLKGQIYKMVAVVPEAEVWLDTYFFEGVATLCDDSNQVVGYAFVEQMGYN